MSYLAAYSLSISDLVLDKEFVKAYGENDIPKIKEILYSYGLDTKTKEFSEVYCQHRNLQNKVVSAIRFEGGERCDKEWINSPYASMYAKIEASDRNHSWKGELLGMLHSGASVDQAWNSDLQKECK